MFKLRTKEAGENIPEARQLVFGGHNVDTIATWTLTADEAQGATYIRLSGMGLGSGILI